MDLLRGQEFFDDQKNLFPIGWCEPLNTFITPKPRSLAFDVLPDGATELLNHLRAGQLPAQVACEISILESERIHAFP